MLCITFGLECRDTNAIIGGPHTAVRRPPHTKVVGFVAN